MWETWVQFLGWEDPLEKRMSTYSSILTWRISWTISSMDCKESDMTNFHFTSIWNEYNCVVVEHSLALSFFGIGIKTDLFQSCGHCWVFQIYQHIEYSTLITLSFRIWTSSAGIPSPPLALLVVMLPKTHLTPYSRMSDLRWMIITSWLSRSLRAFLCYSSVYSCHLFLISFASVSPYHFRPLLSPSLHEMFPWYL